MTSSHTIRSFIPLVYLPSPLFLKWTCLALKSGLLWLFIFLGNISHQIVAWYILMVPSNRYSKVIFLVNTSETTLSKFNTPSHTVLLIPPCFILSTKDLSPSYVPQILYTYTFYSLYPLKNKFHQAEILAYKTMNNVLFISIHLVTQILPDI